jgi:hypothetical protein
MSTFGKIKGKAGKYVLQRISFRMAFAAALVFAVVSLAIVLLVFSSARNQALADAREKSMFILNRHLSIHSYFNSCLKPQLFALTEKVQPPGYFDPVWMSSTFAVREIQPIGKISGVFSLRVSLEAKKPAHSCPDSCDANFTKARLEWRKT